MTEKVLPRLSIAISSCLLGHAVRYDGGHRHNAYITETLGQYFEFIPFCPEVAIGLGVPRPMIQLVRRGEAMRVLGVHDQTQDVTDALQQYAHEVVGQLQSVSGYIFKKGSPSCGMEGVTVYTDVGLPLQLASGRYAGTIMARLPDLPVEEEGRLMDPDLRENFLERVLFYAQWQQLNRDGLTVPALFDFHARHKFIALAHDEPGYRDLGRLVAGVCKSDLVETAAQYLRVFMHTLCKPASRDRHANVLMHLMGFFKEQLSKNEKVKLLESIEDYQHGVIPLSAPVLLIKQCAQHFSVEYIRQQFYLSLHAQGLMSGNIPGMYDVDSH